MILVNGYVRLSVWIESRNAFINVEAASHSESVRVISLEKEARTFEEILHKRGEHYYVLKNILLFSVRFSSID